MDYWYTKNHVERILKRFESDAWETSRDDYNQTRMSLRAGERLPEFDGHTYRTSWGRQRYAALRSAALRDIADTFDRAQREVDKELAEAPSADAVASINALKLRGTVTEQDVMALLRTYGGNYQARAAIEDVAREKGIHVHDVKPNHEYRLLEAKRQANAFVNDYAYKGAGAGLASYSISNVLDGRDALGRQVNEWGHETQALQHANDWDGSIVADSNE